MPTYTGRLKHYRLMESDIDLLQMKLTNTLELSNSSELRLPLLWTAILAGRTEAFLAVSTGVTDRG